MLSLQDGRVTFLHRLSERQGGDGKRQTESSLPVDAFIGRWLEHVPPRRFQTVRGYGLYSGNQHSHWSLAAEALGVTEVTQAEEARSWQDWCEAAGMAEACQCPKYGKQLISHHEFAAGRGPPVAALPYRPIDKQSNVAGGMIA